MKHINILVIATKDKRKRYRFLTEPMKTLKNVHVDILKNETHIIKYISQCIRYAICNKHIDLVIIAAPDYNVILWLCLTRLVMRSKLAIRTGGDFLKVARSRAKLLLKKRHYLKAVYIFVERSIVSFTLQYIDYLIVVNNFSKKQMRQYTRNSAQIVIIPQPVTHNAIRNHFERDDDSYFLLTVTNLRYEEKFKGVQTIVKNLVSKCKEGNLKHKLIFNILGGGDYLPALKEVVEELKFDKEKLQINVVGYIPAPQYYYKRADIFVYCSRMDGLPNVLLEAQSYGLPIIVNKYEPFWELLDKDTNAFFFDEDDADSFYKQLNKLLQDENLRLQIGQHNFKKVREEFSYTSVSNRIRLFLEQSVYE